MPSKLTTQDVQVKPFVDESFIHVIYKENN